MKRENERMGEEYVSKRLGKSIFFYVFTGCFTAAFVAVIVLAWSVIESRSKEAEDVEQIIMAIGAYLTEATNDEYEEIAAQIRHDLVLGKHYSADKTKYVDAIPNTADWCRAEAGFPYQACILDLNTAEVYQLDIYEDGMSRTGSMTRWGYDEISETGIEITADLDKGTGTAVIDSGRGIVSVHRMKKLFCDKCIHKILEINEYALEPELILYNGIEQQFYPIENGNTYRWGDYEIDIAFNEQGEYKISMEYIK